MKKIILLLLLLFFVSFVFAGNVIPFPGLQKPGSIKINKDHIYINDGAAIYIYSLEDFSLRKKFGKKGEGPQEFKVHPNINRGGVAFHLYTDGIVVSSLGRVSFFTRDGDYIKEMNIGTILGEFVPFEKQFVGMGIDINGREQYLTYNFYDNQFKKEKEFFRIKVFVEGKSIDPVTIGIFPVLHTCNEKIFINDYDGIIHIFGHKGSELVAVNLSEFNNYFTKVKVTKNREKRYIDFFTSDHRFKYQFERDRHLIKFPEYFPVIKDYRAADDRLYIITYREKEDEKELFIVDFNGKLVKRTWFKLDEINPRELYPYTIKNGKLYQLVENSDSEEWELHIIEIK